MAIESAQERPFDPERTTKEIVARINSRGLDVPSERARAVVDDITSKARVTNFLHIIVPRVAEEQLLPVAVPKNSTLPQPLPETILDP